MTDPSTCNKITPDIRGKKTTDSERSFLLVWPGVLPRFSRMREGGPGRPITLILLVLTNMALLIMGGARSTTANGGGPAMILVGTWLLITLGFWILLKAGLRNRDVTFVIDSKKAEIRPSAHQRKLDRRLQSLMRMVFWLSLKGGQWATWSPYVRWSDVKSIRVEHENRQIILRGGAWDVRLICKAENFADIQTAIKHLTPRLSQC